MKILHTSDWHLGKSLYDFSLIDSQRHALDFLLSLIERETIDVVVIAGDIYDRPVPTVQAVRLYDEFLTQAVVRYGVTVFAVAGNHDSASRLSFGGRLLSNSGYHVFGSAKDIGEPVTLRDSFGEVRFYPVPWFHPAEIRVLLDAPEIKSFDAAYKLVLSKLAEKLDPNVRNVAVGHGFFANISASVQQAVLTSDSEINVGGMDIADAAVFSPFDYAALGHLHAPQRVLGENVRYSGSLLKYSISEEHQHKSCALVSMAEKGRVDTRLTEIPALRDVRCITGTFDELMEPGFYENKNFGDYVFANLLDSGALYPMEKLRTLFPNLLGLRFAGDAAADEIGLHPLADAGLSPLELFGRFYRDTFSAEMPEESLAFLKEVIFKSGVTRE